MSFTLSKTMKLFDFDEAVDIHDLERKAQAGDEIAQSNLAALYIKGKGVDQDAVKACYWFRLAAE